jgi:hypothetical protein
MNNQKWDKEYSTQYLKEVDYLTDKGFLPHLRLAVKIRDYNLDLSKIEKFINSLIKQYKTKTP